jgi:hypothetical protein
MKSAIIVILLVILTGAAFISRPSEASFKSMVEDRISQEANGVGKLLVGPAAELYVRQVAFEDHYLWTTVKKDGRTLYVGAFSKWFPMEESKKVVHEVIERAETKIGT